MTKPPPIPDKPKEYLNCNDNNSTTNSILDDKFADVYASLNKLTSKNQSISTSHSSNNQDSIYNLYTSNTSVNESSEYSPVNPNLSSIHEKQLVVGPNSSNRRAAVLPPPKEGLVQDFNSLQDFNGDYYNSSSQRDHFNNYQNSSIGSHSQFLEYGNNSFNSDSYSHPSYFPSDYNQHYYNQQPLPSPLTANSNSQTVQDNSSIYSNNALNSPGLISRRSSNSVIRSRNSYTPLPSEVLAREDPYANLQMNYSQQAQIAPNTNDNLSSPSLSYNQLSPPTVYQRSPNSFHYPSVQAQSSMHNAQLQSYVQSRNEYIENNNQIARKRAHRRTMDTSFAGDDFTEAFYDEMQVNDLQRGLKGFDPLSTVKPQLVKDIAVQFKDKVQRGRHIKGSVPFDSSFTGKDIVVSVNVTYIYNN